MDPVPRPFRAAILLCVASMLLAVAAPAVADCPIELKDGLESAPLPLHMDILEDPTGELTLEDLLSGNTTQSFEPCTLDQPGFGFTDSVYWLRFTLMNQSSIGTWYLVFGYPLLDDVRVYTIWKGNLSAMQRSGDLLPMKDKSVPHHKPVFRLHPGPDQVYFCRIESTSSIILNPVIWSNQAFNRFDSNEHFVFGLYYGVLLVMAIYNMFLFITLKDKPYLYYVVYIVCYLFFQGSLNGLTGVYLWPSSVSWSNMSVPIFIGLVSFSCLLFSKSFLHISHAILAPLFRLLMGMCLLQALASFVLPYSISIRLGSNLAIVVLIAIITAGIHSLYCRYKPARYFLMAWGVFLAGQLISALHKGYALFPTNFLSLYSGQIGSVLDVILLSLALGDRIGVIQEERARAQEESLQAFLMTEKLNAKLKEINRTLESKVEERTVELTMANEKLLELDRMKSEFLANVSHELRTPLTSIFGFATIIQMKFKDQLLPYIDSSRPGVIKAAGKADRDIGIIITEAQRLTNLINDLLDLSKMEAGRMEWHWQAIRMPELLRTSMDSVRPLFDEKGLDLVLEETTEPPRITGDRERLQQVIVNLLSNAAKYSEAGTVSCRVEHFSSNGESMVRISVSDMGRGIPEAHIDEIFDKFRRVAENGPDKVRGTGLGLSICKEIVEYHGGAIQVESQHGVGSTFSFTVPVTPPLSENERPDDS